MKQVIFIKNGIEKVESFSELFRKNNDITTSCVSYNDFVLQENDIKKISKKASQLIIIVEKSFFELHKKEFIAFLKNMYSTLFRNIIQIYPDHTYLEEKKVQEGQKFSFYYDSNSDLSLQAQYLKIYTITLFDKFMLSERLNDYICNSFKEVVFSELLIKKNDEINRLNKELERKNRIDNLTSLYNRKAVFEFLDKERKRTERDIWRLEETDIKEKEAGPTRRIFSHEPKGSFLDHFGIFSLMMIDIDYFKKVNDTYGHLKGDEVLKELARLLQENTILRDNDIAGRFGGEEFIVILPETNAPNALEPAKRLNETFKKIEFLSEEGKVFHVTLSIGISQFKTNDKKNEDLIHRADSALYYAKENGRDRVVIYEEIKEK